jgi:hypothetical protein
MIAPEREAAIRRMVRKQIGDRIDEDLDCRGEGLMKEVWEDTRTADERRVANDEMRRILSFLGTGVP